MKIKYLTIVGGILVVAIVMIAISLYKYEENIRKTTAIDNIIESEDKNLNIVDNPFLEGSHKIIVRLQRFNTTHATFEFALKNYTLELHEKSMYFIYELIMVENYDQNITCNENYCELPLFQQNEPLLVIRQIDGDKIRDYIYEWADIEIEDGKIVNIFVLNDEKKRELNLI